MNDCATPVTGASSIVGFAHGNRCDSGTNHFHQHGYDRCNDHDEILAGQQRASIDTGSQTRDVLTGQRHSDQLNSDAHNHLRSDHSRTIDGQRHSDSLVTGGFTDTQVAVEKVGAAAELAVEKNGTTLQVQAERIRADQAAQAERIATANTMAVSDLRLENFKEHCATRERVADCCCKLEAKMSDIESARIRDDLQQCRAELIAMQSNFCGPGRP